MRQNNLDGKSWYPCTVLSPTFFDTRNFLKHRRVPLQNSSALWDKKHPTEKFDTSSLRPPFIHKLFRYRKHSETQHRRVYGTFRYCETKQFRRKIVIPATPSLIFNFFRYPKIMKHYRIPLRKLSALRDKKKFQRKNLMLPPSALAFIQKLLRYWKSSETQNKKVPLRSFSFSVLRHKQIPQNIVK